MTIQLIRRSAICSKYMVICKAVCSGDDLPAGAQAFVKQFERMLVSRADLSHLPVAAVELWLAMRRSPPATRYLSKGEHERQRRRNTRLPLVGRQDQELLAKPQSL